MSDQSQRWKGDLKGVSMLIGRRCSKLAVNVTVLAFNTTRRGWERTAQSSHPRGPAPQALEDAASHPHIRGVAPCPFQVNDLTFERKAKRTVKRALPGSAELLCILRRAHGFRAG